MKQILKKTKEVRGKVRNYDKFQHETENIKLSLVLSKYGYKFILNTRYGKNECPMNRHKEGHSYMIVNKSIYDIELKLVDSDTVTFSYKRNEELTKKSRQAKQYFFYSLRKTQDHFAAICEVSDKLDLPTSVVGRLVHPNNTKHRRTGVCNGR